MEFEQQGDQKDVAREVAKHFLKSSFQGNLSVKSVSQRPISISSAAYDAQIIGATSGQVVIDHWGEAHSVSPCHLVVTRVGNREDFAVFDLEELITGIHDEERGYSEGTLAAVFAETRDQPEKL